MSRSVRWGAVLKIKVATPARNVIPVILWAPRPYIHCTTPPSGPGSVVGIATVYGLNSPGIESQWGGEIFRTCPDRHWGPPSLLYNGYRVFPRCKEQPGRAAGNKGREGCGMDYETESKPHGNANHFSHIPLSIVKSVSNKRSRHKNL